VPGTFYATDAFADYSLDFIAESRREQKLFFRYLAFNAPHFPLHAPESDIVKYEAMYFAKGWDTIRAERLERLKQLHLVPGRPCAPAPQSRSCQIARQAFALRGAG
jgi:arylsulfatase